MCVFCSFVSSASAPSRTLARRKLVRNRFTIDTDIIFHGNNNNNCGGGGGGSNDLEPSQLYVPLTQHALLQSQKPQGEDTDRWVEEQFDLRRFEEQVQAVDMEQVKETDILSDDDEYCKSVRAAAAAAAASAGATELHGRMEGLGLGGRELEAQEDGVERGRLVPLNHCTAAATAKLGPLKQCAVEGATNKDQDVVWVRRDDFANGCNSDVF